MRAGHRLAIAFATVTILLLASCLGVTPGDGEPEPDADELALNASIALSEEAIEGVRTETVTEDGGELRNVTVAVTEAPPDRSDIEVLRAEHVPAEGDRTVIDGPVMWSYDAGAEEAERVETEPDHHWLSDTAEFGFVRGPDLDRYDVEYVGTETVGDREAHVVEIVPPEEVVVERSVDVLVGQTEYRLPVRTDDERADRVASERWWIDAETEYPVRQEVTVRDADGEPISTATREYEELTVDPEFEDDAFTFEPPADAEVIERDTVERERFDSVAEAEAFLPFELPDLDLPDRYEFDAAIVTDPEEPTTVSLLYVDEHPDSVSVTVSVDREPPPDEDVVDEGVGAVDGTLYTGAFGAAVYWECEDYAYSVLGLEDPDRLIELAERIGCP